MSRKKKPPFLYRGITLARRDGSTTELELSKATMVKTDAEMIHLDKLKDGTWRLTWSEKTVPDFADIDRLVINRKSI